MHNGSYKEWPRRANQVVLWIGIPTGILLALVAFFGAAKDFGGYMRGGCEAVGTCAVAKPTPPTIPNFTSAWVDGGHNAIEYCEPQAEGRSRGPLLVDLRSMQKICRALRAR